MIYRKIERITFDSADWRTLIIFWKNGQKSRVHIDYEKKSEVPANEIVIQDKSVYLDGVLIGSKPQDNHEGIVSRELWEKVQERIRGPRRHRNSHFMYGTVYCEKCGFPMSRITVTLKGQKVPVWKCSQHIKNKDLCPQGYIKEEELMENIRRQMRWNLFFPKAYAEKIQRVEVGEGVEIIMK